MPSLRSRSVGIAGFEFPIVLCQTVKVGDETIWEGERTTLTSLASKGKLVRERYRLTAEHLHFDAGILSTKAEQIPTWAIRDVDLEQSLKQRAMGIGDVIVACKHGEYTGREKVTLEGVKDPKTVRDLVMQVGKKARLEHQQRSQMSFINVAPGTAPLPGVPSPAVEAKSEDPLERIGKLKQLLDAGALTQDEFNTQIANLLGL